VNRLTLVAAQEARVVEAHVSVGRHGCFEVI
jgi:hypothetical protein